MSKINGFSTRGLANFKFYLKKAQSMSRQKSVIPTLHYFTYTADSMTYPFRINAHIIIRHKTHNMNSKKMKRPLEDTKKMSFHYEVHC